MAQYFSLSFFLVMQMFCDIFISFIFSFSFLFYLYSRICFIKLLYYDLSQLGEYVSPDILYTDILRAVSGQIWLSFSSGNFSRQSQNPR